MFFTILLILWLILTYFIIKETKLINSSNPQNLSLYRPIALGIVSLTLLLSVIYSFNLLGNVNIQNNVMTFLMFVTTLLSLFVVPRHITTPNPSKGLKKWLYLRNALVGFNVLTIAVHFVIFVILN